LVESLVVGLKDENIKLLAKVVTEINEFFNDSVFRIKVIARNFVRRKVGGLGQMLSPNRTIE